jgi:[ribosomal protein S5]-alanine N-acetyltransferase
MSFAGTISAALRREWPLMETAGRLCSRTGSWYLSPRLVLRPVPWDVVLAVAAGHRLTGWADDYPSEGDVVIMDLLHRAGADAWPGADQTWGRRQVVERDSGLAVGGIGFAGPPDHGEVEVGYGIVPSRQGRGYATEAVQAMVAVAWAEPAVTAVLAGTDPGNVASQRVLAKAGFRLVAVAREYRYRLDRPS